MTTQTYIKSFEKVFVTKAKKDVARFVVKQCFDNMHSGRDPQSLFETNAHLSIHSEKKFAHWKGKKAMSRHLRDFLSEGASEGYEIDTVLLDGGNASVTGKLKTISKGSKKKRETSWVFKVSVQNGLIQSFRLLKESPPEAEIEPKQDAVFLALG